MTLIKITAISDEGKCRVPNILGMICPYEQEGDTYTVHIRQHGFHSENERLWQFGFLFERFCGDFLVKDRDYSIEQTTQKQ